MILIVDDRQENIITLKTILELHNFSVDSALSGEEALRKILRNSYSLIILDVQMPGMDGFEVAETISGYSKAKDIPIIFLSAVNIDKNFIKKGYASGGIDYVTKPFDPDILLLKVKTFIRLSEQTRELTEMQKVLRKEIDIRRQAEDALNEKIQELELYLESVPQIAFTADPNGDIEYVNSQWLHYSQNKKNFPNTFAADRKIEDFWFDRIKAGQPFQEELRLQSRDMGFRFFLLSVKPIRTLKGISKWVGTFTDIHEQKMANEILEQKVDERTRELKQTNQYLETTNHELQQFASVASHDLKEPLRKIQVFSTIIRDKYVEEENNGLSTYIDRIIQSSSRLSGLINDLLSFSRLSESSLFTNTDINLQVQEILSDLELLIVEKAAEINVGPLPSMEVIPGQIRQVFQNIISNAIKFSKPGVRPEIKIEAEAVNSLSAEASIDPTGAFCRITVTDNGIGFDERYIGKIFTIFQRLNPREQYEGTGIGLAIAKKIIDKHHGVITAKSRENVGSRFIIVLPFKQSPEFQTESAHT